jgi:hypothetical protein
MLSAYEMAPKNNINFGSVFIFHCFSFSFRFVRWVLSRAIHNKNDNTEKKNCIYQLDLLAFKGVMHQVLLEFYLFIIVIIIFLLYFTALLALFIK